MDEDTDMMEEIAEPEVRGMRERCVWEGTQTEREREREREKEREREMLQWFSSYHGRALLPLQS